MANVKLADQIAQRTIAKWKHDIAPDAYHYFNHTFVLDSGTPVEPEIRQAYTDPTDLGTEDFDILAKHATHLLDDQLMKYSYEVAKNSALELAIRSFGNGKYDGKVNASNFGRILNIMDTNVKVGGKMNRTAKYYTSKIDAVANEVRKLVKTGALTPENGFALEMALDSVSDELEKTAVWLTGDSDEKAYMDNAFKDGPKVMEADEPYMKGFTDGGQNEMTVPDAFPPSKVHDVHKLSASKLAQKRKQ